MWHFKNSRGIIRMYMVMFLLVVPFFALLFFDFSQNNDYDLSFSYSVYTMITVSSVLGFIPIMVVLSDIYSSGMRECVISKKDWDERLPYLTVYIFSAFIYIIMSIIMRLIVHAYEKPNLIFKYIASLLVILWVSTTLAHLLVALTKTVFIALVALEIYGIICQIMKLGIGHIINIYTLCDISDKSWVIYAIIYIALGTFCEFMVGKLNASQALSK